MRNKLMAGVWRYIVGVPPFLWEKRLEKAAAKVKHHTRFMTPEHRSVHHFVVREMPRLGRPIPAELVAEQLGLAGERVTKIVQDLTPPDLPGHEQRWRSDLGVPGDRRADAPCNNLSYRGAAIRGLSGGRVRDALRARATERRKNVH